VQQRRDHDDDGELLPDGKVALTRRWEMALGDGTGRWH
jgi:hypothetical protein